MYYNNNNNSTNHVFRFRWWKIFSWDMWIANFMFLLVYLRCTGCVSKCKSLRYAELFSSTFLAIAKVYCSCVIFQNFVVQHSLPFEVFSQVCEATNRQKLEPVNIDSWEDTAIYSEINRYCVVERNCECMKNFMNPSLSNDGGHRVKSFYSAMKYVSQDPAHFFVGNIELMQRFVSSSHYLRRDLIPWPLKDLHSSMKVSLVRKNDTFVKSKLTTVFLYISASGIMQAMQAKMYSPYIWNNRKNSEMYVKREVYVSDISLLIYLWAFCISISLLALFIELCKSYKANHFNNFDNFK